MANQENGKGNPHAHLFNPATKTRAASTDQGCMQINDKAHFRNGKWRGKWEGYNSVFDPKTNVEIALDIYRAWGNRWNAWCAARGIYWNGRGCGTK